MGIEEAIYICAVLSPFVVVITYGIVKGILGISREVNYKLNAANQHLMFNQLKKGDFLWKVDGDRLTYRFIKDVEYVFYGTKIRQIRIHFHGGYYTLDIEPENAKTYTYHNYYTLYGDAKAQADFIALKRQEAISNSKEATADDVLKATDAVTARIEKIKKNITK